MKHTKDGLIFPEGFLWGAATSAHQVEGNNTNNDWWEAEQSGRVPFQSGKACNQYELFERDFDLAKQMHHNAHRLSIEWSRIEPKEGAWNEQEIEHYRTVLQALRRRGIKSFVTLHHFTNPAWFSHLGGWEHDKAPEYFIRYAKIIIDRLGEYIDFIITINEPLLYVSIGYWEGRWPPFKKHDFLGVLRVTRNFIRAHKLIYKMIQKFSRAIPVGVAANLVDFQPRHAWNIIDLIVSKMADYFWNRFFLNRISRYMDFIGVNYYFHYHIHTAPFFGASRAGHEFSDLGWGIHPEGLYWVVRTAHVYRKPIYITENGLADVKDIRRSNFIVGHLRFLYQNIREGCDVRGYLHWSLIDNFEWADGFFPRFGLIEVNYKTLARIPRQSASLYADICAMKGIPSHLMK